MLRIGPYEIREMIYGDLRLDGGAMFGAVPKAIWSKTNPADDLNRIELRMRGLLVSKRADSTGAARNILIDCGIGSHWNPKFREMFGVDFAHGTVESQLRKVGLKPEDITDVILTHLHFDHAGGLSRLSDPMDPDSPRVASFPAATVYLQKANWENALHPNDKERASYRKESFDPYMIRSSAAKNLKLLESRNEEEILPGITVEISNGHTRGLQIVRIRSDQANLVYPADLIPTSSHIKPHYIAAYDCDPVLAIEEKKNLLARAVEEKTIVIYEHCPFIAAGTISRDVKGNFHHGQSIVL